jgi:O-antigen ligase
VVLAVAVVQVKVVRRVHPMKALLAVLVLVEATLVLAVVLGLLLFWEQVELVWRRLLLELQFFVLAAVLLVVVVVLEMEARKGVAAVAETAQVKRELSLYASWRAIYTQQHSLSEQQVW